MKKTIIPVIFICIGSILIITGTYLIIKNYNTKTIDKNTEIIKEIDGAYTGYQLVLTTTYGGAGVGGQDLGSGTIIKTYNISENDAFYEPFGGGVWKYNDYTKGTHIIRIIKINDDAVEISIYEQTSATSNKEENIKVQYNQSIDINSGVKIADGINYYYSIKIIKP